MKSRGIIFSAPMVRALLAGTKTQTRRLITPQPERVDEHMLRLTDGKISRAITVPDGWQWKRLYVADGGDFVGSLAEHSVIRPRDRLYVKETHAQFAVGNRTGDAPQCVAYRATCDEDGGFDYVNNGDEVMRIKVTKWTPSLFMPRVFSRIELEVTEVRVQRLLEITEDDAKAEGVEPFFTRFPCFSRDQRITDGRYARDEEHRASFACLWDEINGDRALWNSNPWVWAITFKRVEARP